VLKVVSYSGCNFLLQDERGKKTAASCGDREIRGTKGASSHFAFSAARNMLFARNLVCCLQREYSTQTGPTQPSMPLGSVNE